jgi:hypothetical protein
MKTLCLLLLSFLCIGRLGALGQETWTTTVVETNLLFLCRAGPIGTQTYELFQPQIVTNTVLHIKFKGKIEEKTLESFEGPRLTNKCDLVWKELNMGPGIPWVTPNPPLPVRPPP